MVEDNIRSDTEELAHAFADLRSANALARNEGVTAAIRIGAPAAAGLLALLEEPAADRVNVMYALARIGDSRAAEAFRSGLHDAEERVRAYSAAGLARIGDPGALDACLRTLNDGSDPMHTDMTASVQSLGEMGLRAVPPLLDLLTNDDEMTRLHAQRALELILGRRHGFMPGKGFPSQHAADACREEWRANGNYDYSAAADAREQSAAKWRQWLAEVKE